MGKHGLNLRSPRWITSQNFDVGFDKQNRQFIARTNHRNRAGTFGQPLGQLPLGMGIRTIHFIQNQAHGFVIASQQRRHAHSTATAVFEGFDILLRTHRKTRINLRDFLAFGTGSCQGQRGLANAGGSHKHNRRSLGRLAKIGTQPLFDIGMSDDFIQTGRSPSLGPHCVFTGSPL